MGTRLNLSLLVDFNRNEFPGLICLRGNTINIIIGHQLFSMRKYLRTKLGKSVSRYGQLHTPLGMGNEKIEPVKIVR